MRLLMPAIGGQSWATKASMLFLLTCVSPAMTSTQQLAAYARESLSKTLKAFLGVGNGFYKIEHPLA